MDRPAVSKDFLAHVEVLRSVFERADPAALERALEAEDLAGAAGVLGLSTEALEWLLRPGQEFAVLFAELFPQAAVAMRDRHVRPARPA